MNTTAGAFPTLIIHLYPIVHYNAEYSKFIAHEPKGANF